MTLVAPSTWMATVAWLCAGLFAFLVLAVLWRRSRRILTSKRHLEAVFDHVDPMAVIDSSRRILRVNKAFTGLVGKPWSALLGRPIDDFLGSFLPSHAQLKDMRERSVFGERSWPGSEGTRVFDIHIVPVGEELLLHFQEITQLVHARQDLMDRNNVLAKLTQALQGEIEVAREIQAGLLPRELPRLDGIDFLVRYIPSRPVGGDLYDVLPLDERHLGIFIADVSGHGLPAAFEAALVRMSFLNRAQAGTPPSETLAAMNRDLRRSLAVGHYATAFYGILDLETLNLTYCRASHPRPAIIHPDGRITRLASQGLFLGIVDAANYRDAEVVLNRGDRICLFTDGYYEGIRRDGRRLGYDGFLERILHAGEHGLGAELAAIEEQFLPGGDDENGEDDRTFLALDIHSATPRWRPQVFQHFPESIRPPIHTFRTNAESWELVELFSTDLAASGWSARDIRKAQLAASELAVNAVIHGVHSRPEGNIECAWIVTDSECRFSVHDNGSGFDPDRLPDPRAPERLSLDHGRGIFLVRRIVSDLWFDHGGTTASFLFHPSRATKEF